MIEVNCPNCGDLLHIPEQYAGQHGTCKHCGGALTVPAVAQQGAGDTPPPRPPEKTSLEALHAVTSPAGAPVDPASTPAQLSPLGRLWRSRGIMLALIVIMAGALWALDVLPVPAMARTPEAALNYFVDALEAGNVRRLAAITSGEDREGIRAMFRLMSEFKSFRSELEEAYGAQDQEGWRTSSSFDINAPTREQIENGEVQIEEVFVDFNDGKGFVTVMQATWVVTDSGAKTTNSTSCRKAPSGTCARRKMCLPEKSVSGC